MMTVTHGTPQGNATCVKLIHGFVRINGPREYVMKAIAPIIGSYYIGSCSVVSAMWQIPNKNITNIIKSPQISINGYRFMMQLTQTIGGLYFGILYQGSQQIEQAIYKRFAIKHNKKTAKKVVESFVHSIKGLESDEILMDLDDVNESCILAHIEKELMEEDLVAHHQIATIKEDIMEIVGDKISFMANYEVTVKYGDDITHFKNLHTFNAIQQMEQKVARLINSNKVDTVDIKLEIFDDEYGMDDYQMHQQEVNQEWVVAALSKERKVIWLDNFSLFSIYLTKGYHCYDIHLQQHKPNFYNALDPTTIFIEELRSYINAEEVFEIQGVRMKAGQPILCGRIECALLSKLLHMNIGIKWH